MWAACQSTTALAASRPLSRMVLGRRVVRCLCGVCPRFAPPPSTNPILCCPGTTPLVLRCSNGDHVPVDTNHSQSCSRNWPMYARRALLLSIQCPAGGCLQHVSSRVTPLAHGRLHSRRRTCRDCRGTPLYNTQEHWGKHRVSAP